jgi:hypothetical protein
VFAVGTWRSTAKSLRVRMSFLANVVNNFIRKPWQCHVCHFHVCVCRDVKEYGRAPESAYQALMRAGSSQLHDHTCKPLDALNQERCR